MVGDPPLQSSSASQVAHLVLTDTIDANYSYDEETDMAGSVRRYELFRPRQPQKILN